MLLEHLLLLDAGLNDRAYVVLIVLALRFKQRIEFIQNGRQLRRVAIQFLLGSPNDGGDFLFELFFMQGRRRGAHLGDAVDQLTHRVLVVIKKLLVEYRGLVRHGLKSTDIGLGDIGDARVL